jgi:DNA-binding MarR family transcriptional regulator
MRTGSTDDPTIDLEARADARRSAWGRPPSVSADGLLINGTDTSCIFFIYNLFTLFHRLEAARNSVAECFGLTGPQYSILMAVARLEGDTGITASTLAELLQVSPAFIASEVKRLVSYGFLTKTSDPGDRRRNRLQTSEKGRRHIKTHGDSIKKMNDMIFGVLEPDEFRQLVSLTSKLTSHSERTVALVDAHCKSKRALARSRT